MKILLASTVSVVITVLTLGLVGVSQVNTPAPQRIDLSGYGSDAYSYKHISSANASSTAGTVVRGGAGELGSITINTTSAQIVKIYDGDSSATSTATLIAQIKASTAEQTLVYNVRVLKGIVIETPASYAGSITVSHR